MVLEIPACAANPKSLPVSTLEIQTVMPGEIAPDPIAPRIALRFVLESDGGFNAVRWRTHPHAFRRFHLTPQLRTYTIRQSRQTPTSGGRSDPYIVNLLGASFASHHPKTSSPARPDGDARFDGANLMPRGYILQSGQRRY